MAMTVHCRQARINALKGSISMNDLICYCFNYTVADIELDLRRNGRSTILDRILSEKKAGGCDCALKNPKGR